METVVTVNTEQAKTALTDLAKTATDTVKTVEAAKARILSPREIVAFARLTGSQIASLAKELKPATDRLDDLAASFGFLSRMKLPVFSSVFDHFAAGLPAETKKYNDAIEGAEAAEKKRKDDGKAKIDKNWQLTDAQKFSEKKRLGLDPEGANPNRLTDQFLVAIVKLQNAWGSFEQQIANSFTTVMSGAADSLSTAMKGLILGTKDWNSALKEIGNSILGNIAGAISKMAAQWITNVALMGAKWIATRLGISAVEVASDTKEAAAKTPKALLESISSWGGAALLGVAAFTAAMALAGGFADGGYTGNGGRLEPAGLVHRGEWVMPQSTVNAWGHANMAAIQAGPRALGGSATSAAPPNIKVIMVADMKAASLEALKTPAGEQLIVQAVNGKRFQLGLGT